MAKANFLDVILKTINDVQQKNKKNPNEETADPSVFDLLRGKIQKLDEKSRTKRAAKGKSPKSILDMIRGEISGVRRENKKDPNVPTAPKSVFDKILSKLDQKPKATASAGLRKVVQDYNLDVSGLPKEVVQQVQTRYIDDRKKFDHQYAQALHDLIKQYR